MFTFAIFFFYILIMSNVTTAVLICFFGCIFAIIKNKYAKLITIGLIGVIVIFLLFNRELFSSFLNEISFLFGEKSIIGDRLNSIIPVLYEGKTDSAFGDRIVRTLKSIEVFFQYPVLGIGVHIGFNYATLNNYIGMHTEWIDLLAQFGLPIATCLFYFLIKSYKKVKNHIVSMQGKEIYSVIGVIYIFCGFFDPIMSTNMLFVLFIFAPCLIKIFD